MQSLIPAMKELYPNINFCFIQDRAPSHHTKIIQNFLWEELKSRFVADKQWPLSSPDCNLLDYYFWNEVKEKVSSNINEVIRSVLNFLFFIRFYTHKKHQKAPKNTKSAKTQPNKSTKMETSEQK